MAFFSQLIRVCQGLEFSFQYLVYIAFFPTVVTFVVIVLYISCSIFVYLYCFYILWVLFCWFF